MSEASQGISFAVQAKSSEGHQAEANRANKAMRISKDQAVNKAPSQTTWTRR